jgi:uncharacterized protein (TIGR00251 family)
MKHVSANTLAALEPLLRRVRQHSALTERTRGSFYRKSTAYLHFHEDFSGVYADVKLSSDEFTRVRATTPQEQEHLLSLVAQSLGTVKTIQVKVKPSARISVLTEESPGAWCAHLKSPPVDGKANEELIALVAKQFGCSKSAVSIKSGSSGRTKLVRIES